MAAHLDDPNLDSSYARQLNRTPEDATSNIARLPSEDRAKIYGLRSGLENILSRVQQLEETNEEKDLEVERERQLRKNLEDKILQSGLTDMYGDPSVNEELNERLPKAARQRAYRVGSPKSGRSSPKKHRRHRSESDEYSDEESRYPNPRYYSFPGALSQPPNVFPYLSPAMMPYGGGMSMPYFIPNQSTPVDPKSQQIPANFSQAQPSREAAGQSSQEKNADKGEELKPSDLQSIKAASMMSPDNQTRQIARLLQEIDLLKDQNRQLSEELLESQSLCKKQQVEIELKSVSNDEQLSSRATALIQEIYSKQKQRDEAMMERLKLANQERDKALHALNAVRNGGHLHDAITGQPGAGQDQAGVLSALDIQTGYEDLIENLHGNRVKYSELSSRQIQSLTAERDEARLQVESLKCEVDKVSRQVEDLLPIQDDLFKIKKQLMMTQQERDQSLTNQRKLEDEIETLRLYQGLHKSLSKEQSLRDQYNNSLDQMQQLIIQREGHVVDAQKETNKLQAIIQELTAERDLLTADLEKVHASESDLHRSNEKLQRHVNVLQKKLKKVAVSGELGTV